MVREIECPYCHNKIIPKHRFSSATFALLLILGIIPCVLYISGCIIIWIELVPFLKMVSKTLPAQIPSAVADLLTAIMSSLTVFVGAEIMLVLVTGIVPAVVYWAFRYNMYSCPACNASI